MDKNTLFGKTTAGRQALTTRPPGLGPRLRSLLIMVDGKRNLAEFETLMGSQSQAIASLEELMAAGWIEMVGADGLPKAMTPATAPAAPGDALPGPESRPAPTPTPAAPSQLPFSEARRQVVRFINDQLGPMGETLALRVEACKTPADLQAALPRIRDGLKNFKGSAAVLQFDEELSDRLPKV